MILRDFPIKGPAGHPPLKMDQHSYMWEYRNSVSCVSIVLCFRMRVGVYGWSWVTKVKEGGYKVGCVAHATTGSAN